QGYGFSHHDVHRVVRGCPHRRLDFSVEGNDRGPASEDRAPAPALYRCHTARLRADLAPEVARASTAAVPARGEHDGRSVIHRAGGARRAAASTTAAARSAGALHPSPIMASSRENASTWRRRSGVSPNSGSSAAASFSAVQLCWSNSGTTFSPSKRLVRIIEGSRFKIPRPTARYSIADTL